MLGGGAEAVSRGLEDRSAGARRVSGGDPAAVHGRADPRRAPGVGRTPRPIADHEGVRGGSGGAVHPQTVIEHFGTWNAAKRAAGLMPRRFATREELACNSGSSARSSAAHRAPRTSATPRDDALGFPLLAHVRVARDRSPRGRLRRGGGGGAAETGDRAGLSSPHWQLGWLPKFGDWQAARRADETMLTEWQVYRMFEARRGAWATFQFLIRERLVEDGFAVGSDGRSAPAADEQRGSMSRADRPAARARPARLARRRLGRLHRARRGDLRRDGVGALGLGGDLLERRRIGRLGAVRRLDRRPLRSAAAS